MKRLHKLHRRWPMLPWTTLACLVWSVGLLWSEYALHGFVLALAIVLGGAYLQARWDARREDGVCTAYEEGVHCRCWWDDPAAKCCGCGYLTPKRHRPTDVEVSS